MFAILNKLLYKLITCLLLQLSLYNLYIQIDAYKHMKLSEATHWGLTELWKTESLFQQ